MFRSKSSFYGMGAGEERIRRFTISGAGEETSFQGLLVKWRFVASCCPDPRGGNPER